MNSDKKYKDLVKDVHFKVISMFRCHSKYCHVVAYNSVYSLKPEWVEQLLVVRVMMNCCIIMYQVFTRLIGSIINSIIRK